MSFLFRLLRSTGIGVLFYLVIWFIWYIGLEDKAGYFVKARKILDKIQSLKPKK